MSVQKKTNKKRAENFSADLKKLLAAQVKEHRRLWDVTDRLHYRKEALDQSWQAISEVIGRTANECKRCWASLKESSRYYNKVNQKDKSEDEGGGNEVMEKPSCSGIVDWEFAEAMSFLPITFQKRKKYQSSKELSFKVESPSSDCSSLEYYQPKSKRKRQEVVDLSKQENHEHEERLEQQSSNTISSKQSSNTINSINNNNYEHQLATFDWLLKKLPIHIAEEACEEITQLLLNRNREQRLKLLKST